MCYYWGYVKEKRMLNLEGPTTLIYPVSSHRLPKKAPPKEGALVHLQRKKNWEKDPGYRYAIGYIDMN